MTKPPRVLNLNFIATAMLVLAAIFITYQFAALPQEIKGLAGIVLSAVVFALASGADGLQDIRQIVAQAPAYLNAGGWLVRGEGFVNGICHDGSKQRNY